MNAPFELTPDQQQALNYLQDFTSGDREFGEFLLEGYAGTGKTTILKIFLSGQSHPHRIAFTAPTNKAVRVLAGVLTGIDGLKPPKTIYSLLGLRMEASGEIKELTVPDEEIDLSDLSIIVVDEASMINSKLHKYILDTAQRYRLRIIYLGDPAQIPPVGEERSPVWKMRGADAHIVLHKVMRHDNAILKIVTHVREQVFKVPSKLVVAGQEWEGDEGYAKLSKAEFLQQIDEFVRRGDFSVKEKAKIVAWKNVTVLEYNRLVRMGLFGKESMEKPWLPSDRAILTSPAKDLEGKPLASTDEEGTIERVSVDVHPIYTDVPCFHLMLSTDHGGTIRLYTPTQEGDAIFKRQAEILAAEAKANRRLWGKYWEFVDSFHSVRHAYAITSHRSQGSTYETCFVDMKDILLNRDHREAKQCLYVAMSRAKKRLFIC